MDLDSARILFQDPDIVFVAVQVTGFPMTDVTEAGVCLYSFRRDSGGGSCGPLSDVRVTGISGTTRSPSGSYTYSWGPTGPLVFTRTD